MTEDDELRYLLARATPEQVAAAIEGLPDPVVSTLLGWTGPAEEDWRTPVDLARSVSPGFVVQPHIAYLSDALAQATHDAAAGHVRRLVVSMPPRSGKSTTCSVWYPLWLLAARPLVPRTLSLGLVSSSATMTTHWSRAVRRTLEESDGRFGQVRQDSRSVADWETLADDVVRARALGGNIIGAGFNVAVVDDLVKDFAAAQSATDRRRVWQWWTGTMSHRMEPGGSVTVVVGTRWHADDFIGRLLSDEHEGDPAEWEQITLAAIAEPPAVTVDLAPSSQPGGNLEQAGSSDGWRDVIGRTPGEPLMSPLAPDETPEQAVERWDTARRTVGSHVWAAVYQQTPAPAGGLILSGDGLTYWTRDAALVSREASTVLLPTDDVLTSGVWVDSWDTAQTEDAGDWTVGQRWVKVGEMTYLMDQVRGRWAYTGVLERIRAWSSGGGAYGQHVRKRLVEKASSGTSVVDTLNRPPDSAGVTPVRPVGSKEDRALDVTPEWEAGRIVLPHPDEPGCSWVRDAVTELLTFPTAAHDDVVDALTQAQRWLWSARRATASGAASPAASQPVHGRRLPGAPTTSASSAVGARISRRPRRGAFE